MGDAKLLGGDTLARAVERRHAYIKKAVKLALQQFVLAGVEWASYRARGDSATIAECHISLKLSTRETRVKVPGALHTGPPLRTSGSHVRLVLASAGSDVALHGCKGVQSEREVKWEFGPADVSLGQREMLHGGMLGSARGCNKSGRSPGKPAGRVERWACGPLSFFARSQGLQGRRLHRCRRFCTQAEPAP